MNDQHALVIALLVSVLSSFNISHAFVPVSISQQQQSKRYHRTTTMILEATKIEASSSEQQHRRKFLQYAGAVSGWTLSTKISFAAGGGEKVDYKAVAADIESLVKEDPDKGPTLVRLAWHSSGTYDKMSKTGGSGGGTIRFKEELAHGANAGLDLALPWMEPLKGKYGDGLSYADLYTLAGVAAIHAMGGPQIPWSSGRVDQPVEAVTPNGRLPSADSGPSGADSKDADHLRTIFYRMGFNDQEIVALSGAHALGRCHTTASGYDGPWTPTPTTFNNGYFTILSNLKWVPKNWDGPYQYVNQGAGTLMMLPTDLVLLQDQKFLKWVNIYAKDGDRFLKDFSVAFQKLEELGTSNLSPVFT